MRNVLAPLTTVVTIQNLLFETPEAAVFQERPQFKNYFLLVFQPLEIFDHLSSSQKPDFVITITLCGNYSKAAIVQKLIFEL